MPWRTCRTLLFGLVRFFLPVSNAAFRDTYDFRDFLYSLAAFQEFQCSFSALCQLFTFSVGSHVPDYDTSTEINSLKLSSLLQRSIFFHTLSLISGCLMS